MRDRCCVKTAEGRGGEKLDRKWRGHTFFERGAEPAVGWPESRRSIHSTAVYAASHGKPHRTSARDAAQSRSAIISRISTSSYDVRLCLLLCTLLLLLLLVRGTPVGE